MEKAKSLSIGAVAKAAGISPSALRFYESAGLLPAPDRLNGRRRYDPGIFAYLATIKLAQESGFSVAEIGRLLDSCKSPPAKENAQWRQLAAAKIEEIDGIIERATAMKDLLAQWLTCECVSLDDCRLIAERLRPRSPPMTGQ